MEYRKLTLQETLAQLLEPTPTCILFHVNPDADAIYEERRQKQLFPQKEESPCESCWRQNICDNGCDRWEQVYLQRQKRINAYAKAVWKGDRHSGGDVFAYSHPDLVRRYEKTHPCGGCRLRRSCDVPCGRYIQWYDFRMAQAAKRIRN